jgi:hypothetical protein
MLLIHFRPFHKCREEAAAFKSKRRVWNGSAVDDRINPLRESVNRLLASFVLTGQTFLFTGRPAVHNALQLKETRQ